MGDFYCQVTHFIPDFACKVTHFYPNNKSYRMFYYQFSLKHMGRFTKTLHFCPIKYPPISLMNFLSMPLAAAKSGK